MKFIKSIQNFSSQYDLWRNGSRILVAVSGGPDSVCLLDVLSFLSKKYKLELQIVHVNYGLRGQDSDRDEKSVRDLGERYGISVNVFKPKKSLYKGNIESVLREIRYAYFEKMRKKLGFDIVAVGHNQNDQAETVLMRVIRGSGLNGLSAMRPKSSNIIRPLLRVGRKVIILYLKERNIPYRMDKSNEDINIFRNRIRHELIPYLERDFNPSIIQTLSDFSYSVSDDYDFIAKSAERFAISVCKNKKAIFSDCDFLSMHESLQRQSLRLIIEMLSGQIKDIEYSHIEEIRKVIKSSKNKTKTASIAGLKISKKGAKIEIFNS